MTVSDRDDRDDRGLHESGADPGRELIRRLLASAGAPDEVLRLLDSSADPEEFLSQLTGEGLPPPEEALTGMLHHWEELLEPRVGHLEAEISAYEFLSLLRDRAADPDDLPDMLGELMKQAEQRGGRGALALLRAMAVLGPEPVRPDATAAADRLAAGGLTEPPWVSGLGAPVVGACFGYGDPLGSQEVLAMTCRYGRKGHAVAVLIDHNLGGGVKDCWVSDKPKRLRTEYARAADSLGAGLEEYLPAEAARILERALSQEPCPEQPDQIQDVETYLDLLRSRVALLSGERQPVSRPVSRPATVHRLKVTLHGSKPPIWRRLEVPSTIRLDRLHEAIQDAFGWQDYHLWMFETGNGDYGRPDPELGHRDASSVPLSRVAGSGDKIRYTYDFGDDWRHDIQVEQVVDAEPGVAYPRCVGGRRAGPPEDCGGVWGYAELQEVLADQSHPDHQEMLDWLGLESASEFTPGEFDAAEVNELLRSRVLVKA